MFYNLRNVSFSVRFQRLQLNVVCLSGLIVFVSLFSSCSSTGNTNLASTNNASSDATKDVQLVPFRKGSKWGFSDVNKKLVIEAKYDSVSPFSEGLAAVQINDMYGYIDKTGKEIIPLKYPHSGALVGKAIDTMHDFDFKDGVVLVGYLTFIDKTGKEVIAPKVYNGGVKPFSDGLALVTIIAPTVNNGGVSFKQTFEFVDKTGNMVLTPKYDSVDSFSEGLAVVGNSNEKYGYIDKTGKEVIPLKYDTAEMFHDGLAYVQVGNQASFIDPTGKTILTAIPGVTQQFSEGLCFFMGRGYIDKTGQVKIKGDLYTLGTEFSDGLAAVMLDDKWGFIDKTGKEVIPRKKMPNLPGAFHDGFAMSWCADSKECFIDKKGTEYYEP